jgi:4-hydroxy-3-polyprenylbenzoate decarboxylase
MRIIVGISGASGIILGYELLRALRCQPGVEIHLIITENARKTMELETALQLADIISLADFVYDEDNMAASISSGSFQTDGIIVIPCSMKTLSGIANGYSSNLLIRATDVCLKENRRVVLVPREMPLSKVHLRNMAQAAADGCIIIPPMLTLYNNADSVQKQIDQIIGKVMAQFGLNHSKFVPWQEPADA